MVGAVRATTGVVPDSLLAKLMPGSLGWDQPAMKILHAPTADVRVLIGPTNSAGQAYYWAQAAAKYLANVGAVNYMTTNVNTAKFAFPTDLAVPETGYLFARGWQTRQRGAIVAEFTHVLLESGRYLYGPVPWRSPMDVAAELVEHGVAVALLWHGSDIRVPSEHAAWERDSPFGERGHYPRDPTAILEKNARERRRMVDESVLPVFVSTPGLLDVRRSNWLPVVVDPERWRSDDEPMRSTRPVVAYVPSNSLMKGDESIDQQLDELEREGLIRYRRLEGVASGEMPNVYRSADIVLDQFRLGDYGVAACEAMAAGRVVIGHVHDEVRSQVLARTGLPLPILESRYSSVAATIRDVLADPSSARVRAAAGPAFVHAVHDGRMSAQALSGFLGSPSAFIDQE